jgi:hypothetical protein
MEKVFPGLRERRRTAPRAVLIACVMTMLLAPGAAAERPPGATTAAATDVGAEAATLTGVVVPHGSATVYSFHYGTGELDTQTPLATAGSGSDPVAVSARVTNLVPDTTYRVRLVASSLRHVRSGADVTFRTAPAPPAPLPVAPALTPLSPAMPGPAVFVAPPPVFGERVNVTVRRGTVTVRTAEGVFVPLTSFASVPVGSRLNTREGSVNLTGALPDAGTQTGIFHGGLFDVLQSKTGSGSTELVVHGRPVRCRRASRAVTARRRRHPRSLWGNVRHGNFRIRGGWSVASVRGTIWNVEDRCAGTLTRVKRGSVRVRDLRRHRTVVVKAGHSYLARRRR